MDPRLPPPISAWNWNAHNSVKPQERPQGSEEEEEEEVPVAAPTNNLTAKPFETAPPKSPTVYFFTLVHSNFLQEKVWPAAVLEPSNGSQPDLAASGLTPKSVRLVVSQF